MAEITYGTVITFEGARRIAAAILSGQPVIISQAGVGDANGEGYVPTRSQTALRTEWWRGEITAAVVNPDNPNVIDVEFAVPPSAGNHVAREIALYDDESVMIAVGNLPDTQIMNVSGVSGTLTLCMHIAVEDAGALKFVLAPDTDMGPYYLPIANDVIYGSIEIGHDRTAQGMTAFSRGGKEYVVFATANNDNYPTATNLYLYNYTDDRVLANTDVYGTYGIYGHYNDMTYCPADGYVYVGNMTHPTIDVFDPVTDGINDGMRLVRQIDMSHWGDYEAHPNRMVNGIAWSDKEECFYLTFGTADGGTYRTSHGFTDCERLDALFSNVGRMNRQGIYVEKETGNFIQVKFRNTNTFRYPRANRLQIYGTDGGLIATTYLNSRYELEAVTEMADGHMLFMFYVTDGFAAKNVPEGDITGRKHIALFTKGTITSRVGLDLYSNYQKNYLSTSDFYSQTNNIYYREDERGAIGANGIAETGDTPTNGGKPFKSLPSILNYLTATTTKTLQIHLLSDVTWPLRLVEYDRAVLFIGEDPEQTPPGDDEETDDGEGADDGSSGEDGSDPEEPVGTERRAIRDVSIVATKSFVKFDNVTVGGRNLKLHRNEQVAFTQSAVQTYGANEARQGVYLTQAYSPYATYAVGDLVYYKAGVAPEDLHEQKTANLYECTTQISAPEAWTPSHWRLVVANSHPASPFSAAKVYDKGKVVTYGGAYYQRNAWGSGETPQAEAWNASHWTKLSDVYKAADTWRDNNALMFTESDLSGVKDVDLYRTRLVLLKYISAYGAATRFHGVGTSYRIYGNTTADEQYVLRGQPSATPNIACSELTKISQIRMGMNMSVSAVTAGKMTDIPFWLRNGDWDNGTAECSTAGGTAEKAITVAGIASLTDGLEFLITFTHANTAEGDLSLNLNGLGAVPLLFNDWSDGEQVCVKYYAPNPTAGTAARFVRYGLPFTGRAEVLSDSAMLYVIAHGAEEYRRIVEFDGTTITSDSGWQTRDDEIYPINTVVRPEAMADNWAGRRVVVFGDSITNWSHGGYWTNYLVSEAGCAVTNRSVSGAGFARGVNTIIGQLGTKATVTEAGLTATALYGGMWGNGLSYTIAEADDTFTVTVSLDGQVVLTYTGLATIGDLKTASAGNGYLTFDGTDATALTAGEDVALAGAELVESGLFNGAAAVIVAAGTNDANSTETASTIRAAIQTVIDTVKANTTAPIIFITPIRRSHDSSGGDDTMTYSRQRLVGAAICNVAVLNDCSVVNGYDFPIATTGTEWVTDMTLDGLHPEAAGKNVYAHSFLSAVGYSFREKKSIKVLGIGNSHTRDAVRYLYEILAHAGYNAVVGHYYWGGSHLYQQYNALMGYAGQSFPSSDAFYRKYSAVGDGANHSHDYTSKTLTDAIADERWDVVIFQNQTVACAEYWEYFPPTDPTDPHYPSYYPASDYNIDVFAAEVKKRIGNPDLLIGLMAPHTRAYDYAGDEIDGVTYTPAQLDDMIQENTAKVARDMAQCNFIVNTGLAIKYARAKAELDALGHDMTRIDVPTAAKPDGFDRVHLEYGVPMFVAAMTFAMAICGDNMGLVPWVLPVASFSAARAYGEGDVREYNGTIYRKNVTTGAEAWNAAHWDEYDHSPLAYQAKLCARRAVFPRGEHDIGDGPRFYFPDLSAAPVAQSISLVTCEGKAALFDTGAANSWSIIKDYLDGLMAEGAFSGIDVIFLSHYHGDHVGNLANILDNYAKANCRVYLPPSPLNHFPTDYTESHYTNTIAKLENDGIDYTIVTREMTVPVGEMSVELFNTTDEDYAYYDALELNIHNNYSMCALVRYGNTYALYPGDIQSAAQTRIMSQHKLPRLRLYVVHHHGVHGADPAGFFEMLAPEYAVISISYGRFMELSSSGRKPGKYFADHLGSTAYGEYRYACDQSGGIILKGRDIQKVGVGDDVRTLYVNNEYTGTIHDGTDAHPFTQIQEALLFVQEGEYRSWVINIKATDTTYEFVRFFDYPGYIRLVGNASDKALGKYPHVDGAHFSQMANLKLQDLIFDGEGSEDGGNNSMLHFVNSCVTLSNCTIDGGNSSLSSMMGVRAFACYNVFISGGTRFKDLRTGVITTQGSEVFANGAVFENMGLCCYAVNAMNLTIRVADDISNVGSGKYLYTNGSGAPSRLMFVPNTMTAAKAALCTSTVVSQPFYLDSTNVICVLADSKIYNLLTGAEVTP